MLDHCPGGVPTAGPVEFVPRSARLTPGAPAPEVEPPVLCQLLHPVEGPLAIFAPTVVIGAVLVGVAVAKDGDADIGGLGGGCRLGNGSPAAQIGRSHSGRLRVHLCSGGSPGGRLRVRPCQGLAVYRTGRQVVEQVVVVEQLDCLAGVRIDAVERRGGVDLFHGRTVQHAVAVCQARPQHHPVALREHIGV